MRRMNTQNSRFLALLLLVVLAVAGCTGGPAPAADAPVADAPAADQPLDLPVNVDAETMASLMQRPDVVVLDVREQWEWDEGHVAGAVHMPMNDIPARISEIPTDQTVVIMCRSGNRSNQVTSFLRENGFDNIHNLEGGIQGWQRAGFAVEQ